MTAKLPAGSWDAHCHVFGPADIYPWAEPRPYTPEEAPRETLFALHAAIGADRAVIVHPTCHGTDMRVTLDAIAASGGRYRGIALVDPDIDLAELERLHAGGIRGIRFNYTRRLGDVPSREVLLGLSERIAPLGWHIVLHFDPDDMPGFEAIADQLPVPYVIDHMGRIRAERGIDQAPFQSLLRMAADPNCWIKISGADRASSQDRGYRDTVPFAQALVAARPERILWGTDFPHPGVRMPVPEEADLIELLSVVVPDETLRRRILIDNPTRLYGN